MIERINANVQGKLGNDTIDDIKGRIIDQIEIKYEKIFDAKCNTPCNTCDASRFAAYLMFGQENYISVNSKNIEFVDSFHYENFRPCGERMAKLLNKGWVKDFLIRVWIYRLGQYSYFAAEITPLVEENILQDKE